MGTDFVPFHWDNSPGAAALRQKAAEEFAAENAEEDASNHPSAPGHAKSLLTYARSQNQPAAESATK